jgi:hypothetical protein
VIVKNSKEFILFIPGIGAKEPREYLNKLVEGIKTTCSNTPGIDYQKVENSELEEQGQYQIEVTTANNSTKVIDIKEVYWGDLIPRLSSESVFEKTIGGLSLFLFWTFFARKRFWQTIWSSKYILFGIIVTLLISFVWYYGVLAAAFTAIGTNPKIFSQQLPPQLTEIFKTLGSWMGGGSAWAVASIVTAIVPVSRIIDTSYASKCYLRDQQNMFQKVQARVNKALKKVIQSSQYDRVTVIAHSFGVVVATESLSKYTKVLSTQKNIHLVTLGGPLLLINANSKRVEDAVKEVLANNNIESWTDFYSDDDWLCTRCPISSEQINFQGKPITGTTNIQGKFNGTSHNLYFNDFDVIKKLLNVN